MKLKDENKIEQVFKATLKLVKGNGLSGFTMQSVAKEAKIATGTLYIYFKNKEALISSLFDACIKNSAAVIFKNYDAAAPFKIGFRVIWSNILQQRISRFEESVFIEQCFHSPFIDEKTKITVKKMFEPLHQLMKRGKDQHIIKDIDTFWLLAFMIGTINEIAKRVTYFNKKLTQEVMDASFKMCWDGIRQ